MYFTKLIYKTSKKFVVQGLRFTYCTGIVPGIILNLLSSGHTLYYISHDLIDFLSHMDKMNMHLIDWSSFIFLNLG